MKRSIATVAALAMGLVAPGAVAEAPGSRDVADGLQMWDGANAPLAAEAAPWSSLFVAMQETDDRGFIEFGRDPGPAESEGGDFELFGDNHEGYVGNQGLISLQGTRGMFLNPSSGTLAQGQFTFQYCIFIFNQDRGADVRGHGFLVSYGVLDWLEVGGFYNLAETSANSQNPEVIGPAVRARILKDQGWSPETSVGVIWLDGFDAVDDANARQEFYVALSKKFEIDPEGILQGVIVHGGMRQIWKKDAPAAAVDNGTVGYLGTEVLLPYGFSVVNEVITQDPVLGTHVPYSFGLQWKPNSVLGVSVAGVQNGGTENLAFYFGIGGALEF